MSPLGQPRPPRWVLSASSWTCQDGMVIGRFRTEVEAKAAAESDSGEWEPWRLIPEQDGEYRRSVEGDRQQKIVVVQP